MSASTRRKATSNAALLEYSSLIAHPLPFRLGIDVDHSFDMTTVSRSSRAAAMTAIADKIPVTGTRPPGCLDSCGRCIWSSVSRSAPHDGKIGDSGRAFDGLQRAARPVNYEQCWLGALADEFGCNYRVHAATEGDERPATSPGSCGPLRHRGLSHRAFDTEARQIQAVAVGIVTQTVDIELAQELSFPVSDCRATKVDHLRCGGLVVRNACEQEDQARCCRDRRVVPVTGFGEGLPVP